VICCSASSRSRSSSISDAGEWLAVLFVGDAGTIARWTPALHDEAHDFLISPCDPDEFLLRAGRLVAIH
jgi:DNA-binding NtrC family response regulator